MKQKSKYGVSPVVLGLVLCLGLTTSSKAASSSNSSTDAKTLHVINRLSFGPRAGDIENVKSRGIQAYIQSQLNPASIPQPQALTQQLSSLETLQLSSGEILERVSEPQQQRRQPGQKPDPEARKAFQRRMGQIKLQAVEARLLRATASPRQLEEVMVDFWYNHFNVDSQKTPNNSLAGTYEKEAIRPHVLGKFRQMLGATAKHPAMLLYLNNWQNTAPNSPGARSGFEGLNENYARELLELHTLGINGGYSQQDIIALARILTGWGITRPDAQQVRRAASPIKGDFYFDRDRHDLSDKVFLGQTIKGSGIAEGEQALDILARHPATARHISYKLAQYFVADTPPASLVDRLAKRFLETDGDIKAVLDSLFSSQEFLDPQYYNAKFKTPYQYVVSLLRATDVKAQENVSNILTQLGMPLYGCKTPDGYKNTEEAWLNPDAMLRRINLATLIGTQAYRQYQLDSQQLENRIGNNFSPKTKTVIESKPPNERIALMLGSPEFMRR